MDLETQVQRINDDLHCLYQELSAIRMLKEAQPDKVPDFEMIKLKTLIGAKEKLLKTLALDYKIS
jgi:hypothetical protein